MELSPPFGFSNENKLTYGFSLSLDFPFLTIFECLSERYVFPPSSSTLKFVRIWKEIEINKVGKQLVEVKYMRKYWLRLLAGKEFQEYLEVQEYLEAQEYLEVQKYLEVQEFFEVEETSGIQDCSGQQCKRPTKEGRRPTQRR